ncbi:hypothetical protein [Amycolatopsis nigrescens]|uniref:hypothetical protein n=1 Tax=Amycolatopsis nigrescens TaxID=381445 RepID=UPI000361CDC8|nr:hypothetical protein [Amycolatopsis nigrescens]
MTGSGAQDQKHRLYTPVIGGMRHLTWLAEAPSVGSMVRLLCGDGYQVRPGAQFRAAAIACARCDREWCRRMLEN